MPVFRSADPEEVKAVWEAIRLVNHQRQAADAFRLGKNVARILSINQEEGENIVRKCHQDGLLVQVHAVGARGKKRGVESQTYKIPTEIPSLPKHDWYCYECHLAGDVTACQGCHRVFHSTCVKLSMGFMSSTKAAHKNDSLNDSSRDKSMLMKSVNGKLNDTVEENSIESDSSDVVIIEEEDDDTVKPNSTSDKTSSEDNGVSTLSQNTKLLPLASAVKNKSVDEEDIDKKEIKCDDEDFEDEFSSKVGTDTHCYVCRLANLEQKEGGLVDCTVKELNYLLQFTYDRIHTWLPDESLSDMIPSGKTQITSSDEAWCSLYLIRGFPMSLRKMQDKIRRGAYESLTGFSSDVSDIVHHVGILFGVSSEQMEAAKYMLNDSTFDLSEIRQCRDCYRHSNEQDDPLWFAKPCLPRHELVFAKQKGYTYWPAKVIKINADGNYDVRFFGGKHFRGIIDPQCVKPIDTPYQDMQLMKRTVTLNKALEELQKHQELLKRPNSLFTYKAEQSKRSQRSTTPEEIDTDDETKPVAPAKKKKAGRKPKSNAGDKSANKMVPTVKLTRTLQVSNGGGNYDTKPKPRMTRNSLVTAPDMNVYDISTVDEEEKTLDVRLKTPKKTPKKSAKDGKSDKRSVDKEEMSKGKRSCGPKNDESADVDVVSLCNSSDEEGNLITMKTIDYIGETDYSSKPTRAKAHSSIGSSQEALISSTQEIPSTSQNNSNSTSNSSNANRSGAASKQGEAPRLARATQGGGVSRRENFERIKLKVEQASSMKEAARIAHEALMAENERWEAELQAMVDEHVKSILFEVKKRQWCYYCGDEAIYYCCWNTAYCSTTCQQQHWQAEHKRVCRRKR